MANNMQPPYVNPFPHNGHVDIQQVNGSHLHIPVQNQLGAQAIRFATFGAPK